MTINEFEHARDRSPIGDPQPRTSDTEVLDNMIDPLGQSAADKIIQSINSGARRIYPMGPPGVGKTTFAQQLAREISRSSGSVSGVGILYFDDVLAAAEKQMGPRSKWTQEWSTLSVAHVDAIDKASRELGPGYVLIAEMVGVGITDRDVTAFETLALREDPQDLFLPFVADPRIQQKAYEVRRTINKRNPDGSYHIPDSDVQGFLASRDLVVSGTKGLSDEETGRKIRRIIERMDKMLVPLTADTEGDEKDFDRLLGTELALSAENIPVGSDRLPELTELFIQQAEHSLLNGNTNNPAIPIQVYESGLDSVEIIAIEKIAEYYEQRKKELGLSRSNFMPIYNLLIKGKPIHYLDLSRFKDDIDIQ